MVGTALTLLSMSGNGKEVIQNSKFGFEKGWRIIEG
jgi:hypothetical protein